MGSFPWPLTSQIPIREQPIPFHREQVMDRALGQPLTQQRRGVVKPQLPIRPPNGRT